MQIDNEILYDFIHCQYKAYRKNKQETGILSDYQNLYNQLKQTQKKNFEKALSENANPILSNVSIDSIIPKDCFALNLNFKNENVDLTVDVVEFTDKKHIFPIFITPFEKVTKLDKLFVALQASFIQNEFNFGVEICKVVFGKNTRQTKFKLSSFTRIVKKTIGELNKALSNTNAQTFFMNRHCQVCEFHNSCLNKLIESDDLSLLAGLKPKDIAQRNNMGVFSVKQLSYTFRPKKNPYRKRKFLPELKALAIREEKTFIQEIPNIPISQNEIFFDIEGLPDRNFYYLIGVIIRTNGLEKIYSFWATNEDEEKNIFIEFISLFQPLEDFTVYHYGSYETQALKTISKTLPSEQQIFVKKIIDNSFNILNIFTNNIYPPTYSNSLKEIARFLKFEWSEKDSSGLQSTVWRYNWELSNNDELKNKLINYNLEDCRALMTVKDWLIKIPISENENFTKAETIKRGAIFKWQRNNFLVEEFNQINRFAYFNYQREKIYFKTYPKIAVLQKSSNSKRNNSNLIKPNKTIQFPRPENCPRCMGQTCWKHDKYVRTVIDLKITKTMIKRQVISYHLNRFECADCNYKFSTKDSLALGGSKYGQNLSCWIINQSVFYRNSYNKISAQLKESFDIDFRPSHVVNMKSQFSEFYKAAFDEIVEKIKSSNLIHVDETVFHIRKKSSCYVWVFTNIDSVFYLFKPTRESDFLKELLLNFKGVLISDFYAGYDAVNCVKQRCLIHLIRDLNDDLAKHQLDNDFKIIVLKFSKLLNEIVATVNKFGLKKRNLNKHKNAVLYFFKSLSKVEFETEICIKWQKRFNSSKDELFTFLDYDGIPWNNNNAENAIKAVALYRRESDGLATENRIQENLTLLSIQQTCKFRGINFMEFLRSGEKNLSEYSKK